MKPFQYQRAKNIETATSVAAHTRDLDFVAGGTTQIDLMKENVLRPDVLLDINPILSDKITAREGGLRIGARATNANLARHPEVLSRYPGVAEAILSGASPQIRNVATLGGNLLQKTRCPYFRDTAMACNKREPGSGCAALGGINAQHAILGASPDCIALYQGDLAVSLYALDAVVHTVVPGGARSLKITDLHRLPADAPQLDTTLAAGEIITFVDLPAFGGRSHYLKIRDRSSYAYARVSCAVALEMEGDQIKHARIALGSVAHKPWRATEAEAMLAGQVPSEKIFREAARAAFAEATPLEYNAYKIPLGQNLMVRALMETSGVWPLQGAPGTVFAASVGAVAGLALNQQRAPINDQNPETNRPDDTNLAETQTKPTPDANTPTEAQPKPTPDAAKTPDAPAPDVSALTSGDIAPTPDALAPNSVTAAPTPSGTAPTSGPIAPTPTAVAPTPNIAAPTAVNVAPIGTAAPTPLGLAPPT